MIGRGRLRARAAIARDDVYLSNVVKHFGSKSRGKRRIHQAPERWRVHACLPGLGADLALACLQALALVSTHPASVLRPRTEIARPRWSRSSPI